MPTISVSIETPLQPDVTALLQQSDSVAARLYPGEYRRPIDAGFLAKPGTDVLVARRKGLALGMCVLFNRGDCTIELKRMIVDSAARGMGIGWALVEAAEVRARALDAETMLLEVGVRNVEAQQLYQRAGFEPCPAFAPYHASPISLFMRLSLV
ncbi:GNAT family N-acetyltransferase [Oryzifoliimicrobium ureilyticus]|uniref:GNAT family N-acetyltransferase n=1 Tax=Oryzifoliimicrobium ureilyticus TaxID=3113724 RepID=UPI0030763F3B